MHIIINHTWHHTFPCTHRIDNIIYYIYKITKHFLMNIHKYLSHIMSHHTTTFVYAHRILNNSTIHYGLSSIIYMIQHNLNTYIMGTSQFQHISILMTHISNRISAYRPHVKVCRSIILGPHLSHYNNSFQTLYIEETISLSLFRTHLVITGGSYHRPCWQLLVDQ